MIEPLRSNNVTKLFNKHVYTRRAIKTIYVSTNPDTNPAFPSVDVSMKRAKDTEAATSQYADDKYHMIHKRINMFKTLQSHILVHEMNASEFRKNTYCHENLYCL